jgi:endonuclease/exonuclease/phosphatase family metal-dependent hydrolase
MTVDPASRASRCAHGPAEAASSGAISATAPTSAPARTASTVGLRIATLNVWNTFGPWPERRCEIVAQLLDLCPDVTCLQEVVHRAGYHQEADLIAACLAGGLHLYGSYAGRPFEDGLLGNALLTRTAPTSTEICELPVREPGEAARLALAVRTPEALTVTVHLSPHPRQQDLRVAQCRRLSQFLLDLRARHVGVPLILAGDFNCAPGGPELATLRSAGPLTDCWEATGTGPGHTWLAANPFTPAELNGDDRYDYLLHWPATESGSRPRSARVFGGRPLTGVMLSDHLGVVVDIG